MVNVFGTVVPDAVTFTEWCPEAALGTQKVHPAKVPFEPVEQ